MNRVIPILLVVSTIAPYSLGQEQLSKPPIKGKPAVKLVPFHMMAKASGFAIVRADGAQFIEMSGIMFTATAATIPKLTKPTNIVQLTYGSKKGGIGVVYLAPKSGNLTAEDVIKPAVDKRILKDRQYFTGWSIKSVPNSKLLIMVSGTTPEVRDALAKSLK